MRGTDRFLIAIVAAILVLVVAAFVVTLTRPEPTYRSDETPEGVAHNYLLAMQQDELERAYRYLSPQLAGYPPSEERFVEDVLGSPWSFNLNDDRSLTLRVDSSNLNGDRATVTVRETVFYRGDPFGGGQYDNTFRLRLRQVAGAWKIEGGDRYWLDCWEMEDGCR